MDAPKRILVTSADLIDALYRWHAEQITTLQLRQLVDAHLQQSTTSRATPHAPELISFPGSSEVTRKLHAVVAAEEKDPNTDHSPLTTNTTGSYEELPIPGMWDYWAWYYSWDDALQERSSGWVNFQRLAIALCLFAAVALLIIIQRFNAAELARQNEAISRPTVFSRSTEDAATDSGSKPEAADEGSLGSTAEATDADVEATDATVGHLAPTAADSSKVPANFDDKLEQALKLLEQSKFDEALALLQGDNSKLTADQRSLLNSVKADVLLEKVNKGDQNSATEAGEIVMNTTYGALPALFELMVAKWILNGTSDWKPIIRASSSLPDIDRERIGTWVQIRGKSSVTTLSEAVEQLAKSKNHSVCDRLFLAIGRLRLPARPDQKSGLLRELEEVRQSLESLKSAREASTIETRLLNKYCVLISDKVKAILAKQAESNTR
jgi:hypothetical protein